MFFKNAQLYRLPAPWAYTADQLEAALAPQAFVPSTSNELLRQGWESPRGTDQLVHAVNRQFLLKLTTEKKLLPTSVINQVAKERAAELEEEQGFAPGKKAMKELKERVTEELLPRAFPIRRSTQVWIDPVNGWLVVDTPSAAAADDVVKMLLKAVDRIPLESLRVMRSPVACMTSWLHTDEAPAGFTVDRDATLQATGESRASVSYKKHTLDAADIAKHIGTGKQCVRLALTWNDKISFVLTESLTIKSIAPLDVIRENVASTRNDDERFDSDFVLMAGELAKMLADIVEALGGEDDDLVSSAQKAAAKPNVERAINLTSQLYSMRAAARHRLGDGFAEKMEDIGQRINEEMIERGLGVIEAAMAICKTTQDTQQHVLIMAAAVELAEPSEVAA